MGKYYHDDQIFREHYAGIKAHTEELITTAAGGKMDGLLTYSGWGDWCPPSGCEACWPGTPDHHNSALVSTFYYIKELRVAARYAGILGKPADASRYSTMATNVSATFNAHFYDKAGKTYTEPGRTCGEYLGPQTTISLAAELGLIPEADYDAVIDNLVADVAAHDWHLNVGIVGIKYLLPALSAAGRGDVALMIAQARTPPSYIYMVEQGATTLWETWTGSTYSPVASWNHVRVCAFATVIVRWRAPPNRTCGAPPIASCNLQLDLPQAATGSTTYLPPYLGEGKVHPVRNLLASHPHPMLPTRVSSSCLLPSDYVWQQLRLVLQVPGRSPPERRFPWLAAAGAASPGRFSPT